MSRVIRGAAAADLPGIVRVEQAAGRTGDATAWFPPALVDPLRMVLVAAEDERILGWGKTHHYADAVDPAPGGHYLGGVTVDPEARRSGIATALTLARCAWIAERDTAVHCIVSAVNPASLALHRRLGFAEVTRAPSFHGVTFDAGQGVLLTRPLTGPRGDAQQPPSAPEGTDGGSGVAR